MRLVEVNVARGWVRGGSRGKRRRLNAAGEYDGFVECASFRGPRAGISNFFFQKMSIWVNKVNRMMCLGVRMWRMEKVPGHGVCTDDCRAGRPGLRDPDSQFCPQFCPQFSTRNWIQFCPQVRLQFPSKLGPVYLVPPASFAIQFCPQFGVQFGTVLRPVWHST